MAVKRYERRFGATYHYVGADGEEDIPFVANGNLLPIFKTITGVELSTALDEYMTTLNNGMSEDKLKLIFQLSNASNSEEMLSIIEQNPELCIDLARFGQDVKVQSTGMNLIDALLISMRICAMPKDDWQEALTLGEDIIPDEVFQSPTFALEILKSALSFNERSKKKYQQS